MLASISPQLPDSNITNQRCHLTNCNLVELSQPLALIQVLVDEDGVEAFQVGEDDQLFQGGIDKAGLLGLGRYLSWI